MNQMRVQIDGKTRVAKMERSIKMRLMGFESRYERDRFRRIFRNTVGFLVTIGEEKRVVVLTKELLDMAERGSKTAKAVIASEIVHAFRASQESDSAP